jgi:transcriptional regulator with XRE-family HTH domain
MVRNLHRARRGPDLGSMLRHWRDERDPAEIAGFVPRHGHRRVTQADIGELTGVSERWYRALENGEDVQFSEQFLARVDRVFGLDEAQRVTLYLLATGHDPPSREVRPAHCEAGLRRMADGQPWPTYISDAAWDVLYSNDEARRHWPWMSAHDANIMTWVLAFPDARMQLIDWETTWARPMLAQLRMAAGHHRDHERLQDVVADVLDDNPTVRRLWDEDMTAFVHPDGDVRRLYMPALRPGPVSIEVLALSPLRDRSVRVIHLVPFDEDQD